MAKSGAPFQDQMRENFCWGCGADNPDGLQLKSNWDGDLAVATWMPHASHAAGPRHFLNGGIIATLLDCHGICTAVASAYRRDGREIGTDPDIWCATASMSIEYLRPAAIDKAVSLRAHESAVDERVSTVECVLESDGKVRAQATVRAVRVPDEWRHGSRR